MAAMLIIVLSLIVNIQSIFINIVQLLRYNDAIFGIMVSNPLANDTVILNVFGRLRKKLYVWGNYY